MNIFAHKTKRCAENSNKILQIEINPSFLLVEMRDFNFLVNKIKLNLHSNSKNYNLNYETIT